jgi:ABC-2 type transport system permease protein
MFTPGQLFRIRLRQETSRKLKAWGSVMDWTVWLYLLIPGIVISGGLYRELWLDMPEWAFGVPWIVLYPILMFVLLLLAGEVAVPVEAADKLLLLQRPQWLQALKVRAMMYAAVKNAMILVVPFGVLLPFLLRVEALTWLQIGMSYSYTVVVCLIVAFGGLGRQGKRSGWRKWLLEGSLLLLFGFAYVAPMIGGAALPALLLWSTLIGILVMIAIMIMAIRTPLRFEAAVKEAETARHRSTEMLMSQVMESQPLIRWKRPYIFRRSQRIFRKRDDAGTLLAELRLKAFLRAMTHLRVWASFTSIASYAVGMVPVPVAFVLLVSLPMVGNSWLQLQWRQWFTEEFIAQFRWTDADVKRAMWLSRFWLLLPPILIWSGIAGYKLDGMWTALLSAAVGGLVWRAIKR